uniref:HTH La-type RNA-binding domain-containing protein n=1 Tax=Compsopogon caeruleus TaxID=31354 RepID=A0A7S1THP5_9RHOD|mmetsp:Transcript_7106/g.14613  ORF Transcript_7106/g.14613 Transcript_7106/m.14613 type:complete len:747 (+) Transcript_7106:612-2852(+)|eukprot:CAMPEP_0184677512 /NCGR_PEP_ID=MMETSP0312-20130426/88_1 /TAXON_ID=31354 /ORGANISM="Compsopogon coeruleus, Strain SAG 36.94" /LENGTH=746 /DNA_ID=CAMNT_0027125421 /DNA_START=595 /DNA_END=2835 /DNA_ORIENTATION=-
MTDNKDNIPGASMINVSGSTPDPLPGKTFIHLPSVPHMQQMRPMIQPIPAMASMIDQETLCELIVRQVEWYLGRQNLSSDYFLQQKMDKDNGYWVNLEVIASFPKMKRLGAPSAAQIAECLSQRSSEIEVDMQRLLVRPHFMLTEPKRSVLILRDIPSSVSVDEVRAIFGGLKIPAITSMRPDVEDTWFVSFEDEEGAYMALDAIKSKLFHGRPVKGRARKEAIIRSHAIHGVPPNGSTLPVFPGPGPTYQMPFYQSGHESSFPGAPFLAYPAFGPPAFSPTPPSHRGYPGSAPMSPYGFAAGQISAYVPYEPLPQSYAGRGGKGRGRGARLSRENSASSATSYGDRSNSAGGLPHVLAPGSPSVSPSVQVRTSVSGKEIPTRPGPTPVSSGYSHPSLAIPSRDVANGSQTSSGAGRKKKLAGRQSIRNERDPSGMLRSIPILDDSETPDGKASIRTEKTEVNLSASNFPPLGTVSMNHDDGRTSALPSSSMGDCPEEIGNTTPDTIKVSREATLPIEPATPETTNDNDAAKDPSNRAEDSRIASDTYSGANNSTTGKTTPAISLSEEGKASEKSSNSSSFATSAPRSYAEILRAAPQVPAPAFAPGLGSAQPPASSRVSDPVYPPPDGPTSSSRPKTKVTDSPRQVVVNETVSLVTESPEAEAKERERDNSSIVAPSMPVSVWANKPKSVLEASPVPVMSPTAAVRKEETSSSIVRGATVQSAPARKQMTSAGGKNGSTSSGETA